MKLLETRYYKGNSGHQAETLTETDANGKVWNITTHKGRGNVYCSASQGQDNGNGSICYNLSNMMAGDCETYFRSLASEDGQCNEAKVRRVHEAGLKAFLQRVATLPEAVKPYTIEVGQIIFDNHDRRTTCVIYVIEKPGHYKAVDLEGTRTENVSMLEKGDYTEGNLMPMEQVNELVNKAHEAERERSEKAEKEKTAAAIERNQKIAAGIKIIAAIPEGVQAVIVAELHQNESDSQSDYFAHSTKEIVYLSWSTHTKDIFSEMRKAAGKFEHTKQHATAPQKPDGAPDYWTPEDEHREKWSMGSGYYLKDGHSHASAWSVSKTNIGQYGPTLEALQIAAAEGRFFCNEAAAKPERATAPQIEAQPVTAGTVQIVDYSEKAIAVIGDTKPIKDKLKALGGKFNFRLSCGAGWIFRKADLEKIQKALSKPAPEPIPTAEEIEEPEPTPAEITRFEEMAEHSEEKNYFIPATEAEPAEHEGQEIKTDSKTFATYEEAEREALLKQRARGMERQGMEAARQQFCNPQPLHAPGFIHLTPPPPASINRERENTASLKLYSEHGQGQNTGRAQQGFLF